MSLNQKRHLISALTTFGSSFILFLSFSIQDPSFPFTKGAIASAVVAALVASVRAVAKYFIEQSTGTES